MLQNRLGVVRRYDGCAEMRYEEAFSMRFSAEMDARPRIHDDLAFWNAHRANAGIEEEQRLVTRLSDEYLAELQQVTPIAWLKDCLAEELLRRQGSWFGGHGRLSRAARRVAACVRLPLQRVRD